MSHRRLCENSVVPPGLGSIFPFFPPLKRWAKLARPSGAALGRPSGAILVGFCSTGTIFANSHTNSLERTSPRATVGGIRSPSSSHVSQMRRDVGHPLRLGPAPILGPAHEMRWCNNESQISPFNLSLIPSTLPETPLGRPCCHPVQSHCPAFLSLIAA